MRLGAIVIVLLGCSSPSEVRNDPTDSAVVIDTEIAETTTLDAADAFDAIDTADATPCGCAAYSEPVAAGAIATGALDELSGLAGSRAHPGVIWAHNDSGDTPRIFAIGDTGASLGEVAIRNATAVDWEDLALGPCPSGSCLYIADFGDNGMARTNLAIYRIAEPNVENKPFATLSADAEKFPFAYPDGRWNAEALLVHPTTGEMVIVTKGSMAGVYRFPAPLTPGALATLVRVGAPAGLDGVVTGGDVSPCGDRALLRTYSGLFEYVIAPGKTAADALTGAPKRVPVRSEPQGEAVTYRADGLGYLTASEGTSVPLFATACR